MKDILKDTGIVVFVCVVFSIMLVVFTPYPVASMIHHTFETSSPAKKSADFNERKEKITVHKNLSYASLGPSNQYDLMLPKEGKNHPIIIWVHGGAYVGGQKEDSALYAEMLASEGYAVANMSYDLAPNSRYPLPLIQIEDLYKTLEKVAKEYQLDINQVYFAGDSAGGQLITQFVNIQVNETYRKRLSFEKKVPVESIKGVLLYCVPFSLNDLAKEMNHFVPQFFVKRIGWAYTGNANWKESDMVKEVDVLSVVTENFPPTFIADANTLSFEEQGKMFAKELKNQGTYVETAFYPKKEGEIMHEYQFDLTVPQAQDTFYRTLSFLKQTEN